MCVDSCIVRIVMCIADAFFDSKPKLIKYQSNLHKIIISKSWLVTHGFLLLSKLRAEIDNLGVALCGRTLYTHTSHGGNLDEILSIITPIQLPAHNM